MAENAAKCTDCPYVCANRLPIVLTNWAIIACTKSRKLVKDSHSFKVVATKTLERD